MSTKRGKNISKQEDKNKSYKKTTLRDKRQITFIIIVVVLRLKLRTMYRAVKTGFHLYKDLNMNPIHKINKKRGEYKPVVYLLECLHLKTNILPLINSSQD